MGFTEAEGYFQVVVQEFDNKPAISSLRYSVSQHGKDSELIGSLVNYLGCGRSYSVYGRNEVYYLVSTFKDIDENIIPIFAKNSLLGYKKEDYLDLVKVANLIKSK